MTDAAPTVLLTTTDAAESVQAFLRGRPRDLRPRTIAVDAVPDSVGGHYTPVTLDTGRPAQVPEGPGYGKRGAGPKRLRAILR